MIAELGLAALWLSAALAVLQMVSGIAGMRVVSDEAVRTRSGAAAAAYAIHARPAAVVQAVLAVLAFALLLYAFAITDLSIKLVATNSHSAKPLIYKLTGTWGNHEGSMLLWVAVLAVSGGLLAGLERRLHERTMSATLGVQGFVALGFYAFLLFSSNPFERLPIPAIEGVGAQPVAAGHRPRGAPAHVVYRLCRSFGRVQPGHGRAADAFGQSRFREGPAALGAGGVGVPDVRNNRRIVLGLLRIGLGRMVVLGPGRERIAHAVARRDGPAAFGERAGRTRCPAHLDDHAGRAGVLHVDARHVPGPVRRADQRARFRGRSRARDLHPRAAGIVYRRRAGDLRGAGRQYRGRRAVRRHQPRRGAGVQQCHALGDPRYRPARHALSAADRGVRRTRVGRSALLQPGRCDLRRADVPGHGGRPVAAMEGRQPRAHSA